LIGRLVIGLTDLRKTLARQEGQGLVEYALIASLIGIVCIGGLAAAGVSLSSVLGKTAGDV
jgi:Flp pilus assembly pilin Flp